MHCLAACKPVDALMQEIGSARQDVIESTRQHMALFERRETTRQDLRFVAGADDRDLRRSSRDQSIDQSGLAGCSIEQRDETQPKRVKGGLIAKIDRQVAIVRGLVCGRILARERARLRPINNTLELEQHFYAAIRRRWRRRLDNVRNCVAGATKRGSQTHLPPAGRSAGDDRQRKEAGVARHGPLDIRGYFPAGGGGRLL